MAWKQANVMFIPKPGKLDYTEAKAYRPIFFLVENDGENSE